MDIELLQFVPDGLRAIQSHLIPGIVFWGILMGLGQLGKKHLPIQSLSFLGIIGLYAGLGCAWFSLGSLACMLLGRLWPGFVSVGIVTILGAALLGLLKAGFSRKIKFPGWRRSILPLAFVVVLILVRMAYLHALLLPPYNDSPEHYRLIDALLLTQGDLARNYYHLGFHAMAAVLVSLSGSSIAATMSLLGQSFLILAPLSVMSLLELAIQNRSIAWFGALLTGFGWSMPAFAVNWGKYPALGAVAVLPAVLALVLSISVENKKSFLSWGLICSALAGLGLLHTRILGLFALTVIAWKLSARLSRYPAKSFLITLVSALVAASALWLFRSPIKQFYCSDQCFLLILVCLSFPFAFHFNPRVSITATLYLIGSWIMLILPLPSSLLHFSRTVLDRTFIEVSTFLPLSILGAAGMAGLASTFKSPSVKRGFSVALVCLVLISFSTHPGFEPDPCCDYVHVEDIHAIEWIRAQTASDAVVVISSFKTRNYRIGTDAGIWVEALSGRSIRKKSYTLDWDSEAALRSSCMDAAGDVYIYSGSMPFSFQGVGLERNDAYRLVFEQGGTRIYQIVGCQHMRP